MGKIRDRMRQDLALAGYAPGTQDHYLGAAARFVRRFKLPPEQMGQEHLRTHVAELGASGIGAKALKVQIAWGGKHVPVALCGKAKLAE